MSGQHTPPESDALGLCPECQRPNRFGSHKYSCPRGDVADGHGPLAEIVTRGLVAKAHEYEARGEERVPVFLSVEWIHRAAEELSAPAAALSAPAPTAPEDVGWVACSERLPEIGRTVCVWMAGPGPAGVVNATRFDAGWSSVGSGRFTHWRELPTPPEQEATR